MIFGRKLRLYVVVDSKFGSFMACCKIHASREPIRDQKFEWIRVLTLTMRTIQQLNHRLAHREYVISAFVVLVICMRFSIFPVTCVLGLLFAKVCLFNAIHANRYISGINGLSLQVNMDGSSTKLTRLHCHQVVFQLDVHLPTFKLCTLALFCSHSELLKNYFN